MGSGFFLWKDPTLALQTATSTITDDKSRSDELKPSDLGTQPCAIRFDSGRIRLSGFERRLDGSVRAAGVRIAHDLHLLDQ
jgi:hypothetical protein